MVVPLVPWISGLFEKDPRIGGPGDPEDETWNEHWISVHVMGENFLI
jgi:hypothetical protein